MRAAVTRHGLCSAPLLLLGALLGGLSGCGSSGGSGGAPIAPAPPPETCSVSEQNAFVLEVMQDIYLWNDELPAVDPDDFDSPQELLDALRFEPLDRFSFIRSEAENTAFFGAGQFIGVGLGLSTRGEQLFVAQAFGDGPAAQAGFERGYELVAIGGRTITEILADEGIDAAFGPDEIGVTVELRYRDLAGTELDVMLSKALVTIEPVPVASVIDLAGLRVGYLHFRTFVEPSFPALEGAFAFFTVEAVDELVLDMRYNGGGLISVAEFLDGLLGGEVTAGEVLANWVHNEDNSFRNFASIFADQADALDLTRLAVITSPNTASASELVINALRPFLEVVLIGDTTFGKPVGSYGFTFCEQVLNPTSFNLRNAVDEGDYYDGFTPDCTAEDQLGLALGDPAEASLAEALHYLQNGACSVTSQTLRARRAKLRPPEPVSRSYGWHALTGAY